MFVNINRASLPAQITLASGGVFDVISPPMKDLEAKTVLVTGGGLGIGKSMAMAFAQAGANVFICSRTAKDLDQTTSEIIAAGGNCKAEVVDISRQEQVQTWVEGIQKKEGRLNVLINNAGIYGPIGFLEENNMLDWQKTIEVNLYGMVFATRAVLPYMKKEKRGKIINMAGAGIGSANLQPNFSAYLISKAAVVAFTEAMSLELKNDNIQVNAISPGAVNTRFLDQVLRAGEGAGKDYYEKAKQQKQEGGTPPELAAKLALFLAGDEANFITGKTMSAKWDDYENFPSIRDKIEKTSFLNLRRIDGFFFHEKSK